MPASRISQVVQHLRKAALLHDDDHLADAELLGRFLDQRDQSACAALVRRHGPMVWGVCRRLLEHHDAEDAFQATFLVLVRRAHSVRPRALVANWLHGVAHQTALKARSRAARRRAREKQVWDMPEPQAAEAALWSDVQPLLDQELTRVPEKYRAIIILCDFEGKPRREVARQLGLPEGTVASRLARGRMLLAKRLARRGVTVSAGALATVLGQKAASACVPPTALSATIKAATAVAAGQAIVAGLISANVTVLTKGVLFGMLLNKLKVTASTLLLLAAAGFGAGGALYAVQGEDPKIAGKGSSSERPLPVETNSDRADTKSLPPAATFDTNKNRNDTNPLTKPDTGVPKLPAPSLGSIAPPRLPTPEEMKRQREEEQRQRYLKLQEELTRHLTPDQVASRVGVLEKEVAAHKERAARAAREQQAAEELRKVTALLESLARGYADTDAGRKARRAFDAIKTPPVPTAEERGRDSQLPASAISEKK